MLEILQAPSHAAAFRLSSEITADDYRRIIAELESRLRLYPRIAVYTELVKPIQVTAQALFEDFRYTFAKRAEWHRFARIAVVTDAATWRTVFRAVQAWIPAIEARTFSPSEREAALAWAAELQPEVEVRSGLQLIATTRPDTYAFVWNGKVTRSDVEHVLGVLKAELESHVSVRLLGRIEHMGGIEIGALLKSSLLRVKLLGLRKIERYAVVGGPSWLPRYADVIRRLTGVEMRYFAADREDDAWVWLEARPVSSAESAGGQAEAVAQANARAT